MVSSLTFLGAAGTVTGSKYLLTIDGHRILVDCGLFQGYKPLRLRNWSPLPVRPQDIDTVLLTHAHLDHSGYLPLLVKNGFRGKILCTPATRDLCGILLPDSGHLQEKDAEFANRHGFSKHKPALPLYTAENAVTSLKRFRPVAFDAPQSLGHQTTARFLYAGHILGAAMIEISRAGQTILFSGDLGRPNTNFLFDPTTVLHADYVVVESTYGNRQHDPADPADALAEVIGRTAARGGTVVIPSFAVGRAQEVLVHLYRLRRDRRIPDVPIFLDSPMAVDASEIYSRYPEQHKLKPDEARAALAVAKYIHTSDESRELDQKNHMPKVIISASGMATGGRVLHHLKTYLTDPRNTILFVGFQAGGTRGADLVAGAATIKIHGDQIPVRATVANLHSLSAHADADEIMSWLGHFESPPKQTFITHGEPDASEAMRRRIQNDLGWNCMVPEYRDEVHLEG